MRPQNGEFARQLVAARGGDPAAWGALYHEVAPVVIGYLRAQRLPDPEDVAGEVMLEVVRGLERFEGDRTNFRSWVLAIAHHRLLDSRRHEQRRPTTPTPHDEFVDTAGPDNPEAETLAAVGLAELEAVMRTLTEEQRTVLLLRVIGDLSVADVAAITGKKAGAVKQLQHRAVEALRRALDAGAPVPSPIRASARRTPRDGRAPVDASPTGWAS